MFGKLFAILALLLVALNELHTVTAAITKVSCKDEEGEPVDWYYLYKLPKHHEANSSQSDNSGLQYLYITKDNQNNWTLSNKHIDSVDSMPALTLDPLLSNDKLLTIAYNDEFPNGSTSIIGGHTKGVVVADETSGIWLIHSVPKYPAISTYAYPKSGEEYGQSFLCVTLSRAEMEKVGQQLLYNEPNIYFSRMPVDLEIMFPKLGKVMKMKFRSTPPFNNVLDLVSLGGTKFKSFAKSSKFERDLYLDWLAPTLDANLLVETWRNGAGNLASNCSRSDKVYNIEEIKFRELDISFKTHKDHSKWAVSESVGWKFWRWRMAGMNWICVGDINRQAHQLVRGGGTLCQHNSKVTKLYRELVSYYERCK